MAQKRDGVKRVRNVEGVDGMTATVVLTMAANACRLYEKHKGVTSVLTTTLYANVMQDMEEGNTVVHSRIKAIRRDADSTTSESTVNDAKDVDITPANTNALLANGMYEVKSKYMNSSMHALAPSENKVSKEGAYHSVPFTLRQHNK